ncbi:hypothetical protein ACFLQ2_02725 [archaeon]
MFRKLLDKIDPTAKKREEEAKKAREKSQAKLLDAVEETRKCIEQSIKKGGVIALGTSYDDGITIPGYLLHNYTVQPELAITLNRLVQDIKASKTKFTVVVTAGPHDIFTATALAKTLGVPVKTIPEVNSKDTALLVLSSNDADGTFIKKYDELRKKTKKALCFVLLYFRMDAAPKENRFLPHVLGITVGDGWHIGDGATTIDQKALTEVLNNIQHMQKEAEKKWEKHVKYNKGKIKKLLGTPLPALKLHDKRIA